MNNAAKLIVALTGLVVALSALVVGLKSGGDSPPQGVTIVISEPGDYQRFMDANPQYGRPDRILKDG